MGHPHSLVKAQTSHPCSGHLQLQRHKKKKKILNGIPYCIIQNIQLYCRGGIVGVGLMFTYILVDFNYCQGRTRTVLWMLIVGQWAITCNVGGTVQYEMYHPCIVSILLGAGLINHWSAVSPMNKPRKRKYKEYKNAFVWHISTLWQSLLINK